MVKIVRALLGCMLALICVAPAMAQNRADDTVRVRTREVYIEVLVKDKRTGAVVTDLSREDFEVLDEGKPRRLSHFSRGEGGSERPLAMVLVLDLRPGGAGRYLRSLEVLKSLAEGLSELRPEDEVAVMVSWVGGIGDRRELLTGFTRDRGEILEALKRVPSLVGRQAIEADESLYYVIPEATRLIRSERPDSRGVIVYVSDGLTNILNRERDEHVETLIRANVMFNALICDMMKKVEAGILVFKPLFILGGVDVDALRSLAKQTGGEVVRVHKPEDYGAGLERIAGDLTARYSLGFVVEEQERGEGRMHKLEVRVKGRDSRGKVRKLEVFARRGYYLPSGEGAVGGKGGPSEK